MSLSKPATALLGLAAVSAASPIFAPTLPILRRQDGGTCPNGNMSSPEQAAGIWNDLEIGKALDTFLSENGELNWVTALADEALPNSGDTLAFGCDTRDSPCLTTLDCEEMTSGGRNKDFWILNAVPKLQGAIQKAYDQLQTNVIDSSLSISSIASDFKVEYSPSDDKILKWVAAAFTIAGGTMAAGPNALKGTIGMFAGAFTASAVKPQVPLDATKTLDMNLKEVFKAQIGVLDGVLKLATGGEGDYSTLPDQGGDYTNSVAKFFADGRFLMGDEGVAEFFTQGYEYMNKKLVDVAVQTYGYRLLTDARFEDETSCTANSGAYWLDLGGGRCMRLMYDVGGVANPGWLPADDSIPKNLEKYGMDVKGYFNKLCDCALNGNGEIDPENLPTDGSIPRCFYNTGCQDAETCSDDGQDWHACWLKDEFNDYSPKPEEPAPEEPAPTAPEFMTDLSGNDPGCYGSGLNWADLTGDGSVPQSSVSADINTRCTNADGTVIGLNDFWWDCTEWTKADGGVNHIWWEIQHEDDETADHTLTYDTCNTAWNTEIGGCSSGSQQYHEGFYFMMDPQEGECPYKKS